MPEAVPRRWWPAWLDVGVLTLALVLGVPLALRVGQYDAGRANAGGFGTGMGLMLLGCGVAFVAPFVLAAWATISWSRRNIAARVAPFLIVPLVWLTPIVWPYFGEPGYISYTRGFVEWVRANTSRAELEGWRDAMLASATFDPHRPDAPAFVERADWPATLHRLSPQYVNVYRDGAMEIAWGGGFGHWGMLLDDAPTRPRVWSSGYRVSVEPGVYAWYEVQ